MLSIVFLDAATLGEVPNWKELQSLGKLTAYPYTETDQVVARLEGAQVAITNKVVLDEFTLAQLPALRLICVAATGMNNINLAAAAERGIVVKNVAGYATNTVAQWTMAALFALAMDLVHLNEAVYDGTYSASKTFSYWRQPFYELNGARFGIIGMGAIGRRVAALATAYGATVVYHSTSGNNREQTYPHLPLNELLASCEVVSIHAPLNATTKGLIGAQELRQMRPTAYLLNSGRGGIIQEEDLLMALREGWIAGAALDVFAQEPLPTDHPFLQLEAAHKHKLLLTPHIAWASEEARTALLAGIVRNIQETLI